MQTWGGGSMDGTVQGLQQVAAQVVGSGHSLLEACALCYLQSRLHVTACSMPQACTTPACRQAFFQILVGNEQALHDSSLRLLS